MSGNVIIVIERLGVIAICLSLIAHGVMVVVAEEKKKRRKAMRRAEVEARVREKQ